MNSEDSKRERRILKCLGLVHNALLCTLIVLYAFYLRTQQVRSYAGIRLGI